MERYLLLAVGLSLLVDLLLLVGTEQLFLLSTQRRRILFSVCLDCLHAILCFTPRFRFLNAPFWQMLSMLLMSAAAFGFSVRTIGPCISFVVISLSVRGITFGIVNHDVIVLLLSSVVLYFIYTFVLSKRKHKDIYVPVELIYKDKSLRFTALKDTGNMLRDPLTGQSVLVVGADIAGEMFGLTNDQLRSPVEAVMAETLPGLRLLPYSTIGDSGSLLLALKLNNVRIGAWQGASLVAFAPTVLGTGGKYRGLTGGCV